MEAQLSGDLRQLRGTSPNGKNATLFIVHGTEGWRRATLLKLRTALMLLCPGEDPEGKDWSLATRAGPPVLLVQAGEESQPNESERLAVALIRDGVQRVLRLSDCFLWVRHDSAVAA
ncbi:MAG: hypothetical protein ACRETN_05775 [Nevskiales bacterium]